MRTLWLLLAPLSGRASQPEDVIDRTRIDSELGEVAWPDEEAHSAAIAASIERVLNQLYPPGKELVRRDAHPKAHGCVRAEMAVPPDLDPTLAGGVFTPGARYPAWIRFSNGNPDPTRHDERGDARGMAIKLMKVPGEKLLATERDAGTQDFLLISHPVFFVADPRRYARLFERGASGNPLVKATAPLALGWRGMKIARDIVATRIASPLEVRYWSTVPFQHGTATARQAVKYAARPCAPATRAIPEDPPPNYLRDVLAATLRDTAVCYELLVQPRAPAMSVEDPRIEWSEAEAPFHRVATLTIDRQELAPEPFCEALSFTPWHAIAAHRPLGGVNRVRRVVYEAISAFRHARNGTVPREPTE